MRRDKMPVLGIHAETWRAMEEHYSIISRINKVDPAVDALKHALYEHDMDEKASIYVCAAYAKTNIFDEDIETVRDILETLDEMSWVLIQVEENQKSGEVTYTLAPIESALKRGDELRASGYANTIRGTIKIEYQTKNSPSCEWVKVGTKLEPVYELRCG